MHLESRAYDITAGRAGEDVDGASPDGPVACNLSLPSPILSPALANPATVVDVDAVGAQQGLLSRAMGAI
jgi:hypothetical protein